MNTKSAILILSFFSFSISHFKYHGKMIVWKEKPNVILLEKALFLNK